jgi:hypothetical protein
MCSTLVKAHIQDVGEDAQNHMIGHLNQNLALAMIFYTLLPFAALTLKIILFLKLLKFYIDIFQFTRICEGNY